MARTFILACWAIMVLLQFTTPSRAGMVAQPEQNQRARYLNPNTGQFWTMDSYEGNSEDPLSLHKYLYCNANPINGIDPSGHDFDLGGFLFLAQVNVFDPYSQAQLSQHAGLGWTPLWGVPRVSGIGISWGGGIIDQGRPWEEYLEGKGIGQFLGTYYPVVDFYNFASENAISAKTLNTLTASRINSPELIYYRLKTYIDSLKTVTQVFADGQNLSVKARTIELAIPDGTTAEQWSQVKRAVKYAKSLKVHINVTIAK